MSSAAVGDPPQPMPFRVARPLGLPAKINSTKTFRLDYGPGHITSVKFEPIYDKDHTQFWLPTGRKQSLSSNLGGKHLLVSHMYAPIFLYDLCSEETLSDSEVQVCFYATVFQNQCELTYFYLIYFPSLCKNTLYNSWIYWVSL